MKKFIVIFIIFLVSLVVSTVESAQPAENQIKIPQLTRSVKIFSELEVQLINALKNNNQASLKQLLAEDFEMRVALEPLNPVPYSDWLGNSLSEAAKYNADIEQMSVHDLNQSAIVNFLWLPVADKKLFIVDVWRLEGNNWKLAIRYISSAKGSNDRIPGFIHKDSVIQKKY